MCPLPGHSNPGAGKKMQMSHAISKMSLFWATNWTGIDNHTHKNHEKYTKIQLIENVLRKTKKTKN